MTPSEWPGNDDAMTAGTSHRRSPPQSSRLWRVPQLARAALVAVGFLVSSSAQAQSAEDHWTFALTPYLWLPNVNGTLKYDVPPGAAGSPEASTGPNNYLENLQSVLMISGEARKDKWSIMADVIYLDFADQASNVKAVNFGGSTVSTNLNANTSSSFKGGLATLAGGYTVVETPVLTLDVLGGVRYLQIRASTDWQLTATVTGPGAGQVFPASGSISQRADLWDAIVGVRGRVRLGQGKWAIPYYLDVGTGSSDLTWQGLLGIAYGFGWGDATLAYRHLAYDQGSNKLFQDFRFSGPALGATFRF
jgi:hypothetical protein